MTALDAVREEIERGPQFIPDSPGSISGRGESSREFATRIAALTETVLRDEIANMVATLGVECYQRGKIVDAIRSFSLAAALQGERTQEK